MRTTLRKRSFSSSNSWNRPQSSSKRRKLNFNQDSSNNADLSFDSSQLQSLHQQLMAMKKQHGLNQTDISNPPTEPTQPTKSTQQTQRNQPIAMHKPSDKKLKSTQVIPHSHHKQNKIHKKSNKLKPKPKAKAKPNRGVSKPKSKGNKHATTDIHHCSQIDDHQITNNDNEVADWNTFINSVDFSSKPKRTHSSHKAREPPNKSSLISTATATEGDWNDFLNTRYDGNNDRSKDWIAPEIHTFWEQGPIGIVSGWWNNDDLTKCGEDTYDDASIHHEPRTALSSSEISKKKQNKLIKMDVMKELKQQRLEKRLRDRMESGELVQNMDEANNPFESFFTSALEMGQSIRDGNVMETLKNESEQKKEKKTKIFEPKLRKIKTIATFENDDLFFIDPEQSDEDDAEESVRNINENDMIHLNENSIGNTGGHMPAIVAAKVQSEQILLKQRVEMQHKDIAMHVLEGAEDEGGIKRKSNSKDGVVPSNILSNTVEDSLKEKKILKRLNVMDFVSNYKDAFFREVEELNLNVSALMDNWSVVKKNEGLSRKLRKKLGIIMARERKRREKKKKMQDTIDKMINESESEYDSECDEDINDDSDHDIDYFLNE